MCYAYNMTDKEILTIKLAKYIAEDDLLTLAEMVVIAENILKDNDCDNLKEILKNAD